MKSAWTPLDHMSVRSTSTQWHYIQFVESVSKWSAGVTMTSLAEAAPATRSILIYLKSKGVTPKRLRCDSGSEFMNKDMDKVLADFQIMRSPSPPYQHWKNGTNERAHLDGQDGMRSNVFQSGMGRAFWGHAFLHKLHIKNNTIDGTGSSPTRKLFGESDKRKPIPFGSLVMVLVSKEEGRGKLGERSVPAIFLNYPLTSTHSYRIRLLESGRILLRGQLVKVYPDIFPYNPVLSKGVGDIIGAGKFMRQPLIENDMEANAKEKNEETDEKTSEPKAVRRSGRNREKKEVNKKGSFENILAKYDMLKIANDAHKENVERWESENGRKIPNTLYQRMWDEAKARPLALAAMIN